MGLDKIMDESKVALIIPARNAGTLWDEVLESIAAQSLQPRKKILIDTVSTDGTVKRAQQHGFSTYSVNPTDFNHGLTRQRGSELAGDAEVLIYMTQDAVLHKNDSLELLVSGFKDPVVAATYGRQIPCADANAIELTMRLYNYPETSIKKTMQDIPSLGIHTPFCSDTFSAYRKKDLQQVGGFSKTDFGEDMLTAAKMLLAGKAIFYNSKASVIHSHNDTLKSAFQRGRAIGKMHQNNRWLLQIFGSAERKSKDITVLSRTILKQYGIKPCIYFTAQNIFKYAGYTFAS